MNIFAAESSPDINKGVKSFLETEGAVLLDVRTEREYQDEHIPDSINIPLNVLPKLMDIVPNKSTPIFAYCLSGERSGRAVKVLEKFGYTHAVNIGGIALYEGTTETLAR